MDTQLKGQMPWTTGETRELALSNVTAGAGVGRENGVVMERVCEKVELK